MKFWSLDEPINKILIASILFAAQPANIAESESGVEARRMSCLFTDPIYSAQPNKVSDCLLRFFLPFLQDSLADAGALHRRCILARCLYFYVRTELFITKSELFTPFSLSSPSLGAPRFFQHLLFTRRHARFSVSLAAAISPQRAVYQSKSLSPPSRRPDVTPAFSFRNGRQRYVHAADAPNLAVRLSMMYVVPFPGDSGTGD